MKLTKGLPRPAKPHELVGLDIEIYKMSAPRLHRPTGTFACLSIAFEDGSVYQIYELSELREALKRVSKGLWVFQNALFDVRHLRRWADVPERFIWDTMVVEQDLFGGLYEGFSLADLTRRWLGKQMPKEVRNEFSVRDSMTKEMEQYAARDAHDMVKVARHQMNYIEREHEPIPHYTGIDEPAIWAILEMGPVHVDVDRWLAHAKRCEKKGEKLEIELGFNVKSPDQVKREVSKYYDVKDSKEDTLKRAMEKLPPRSKGYSLIERILETRMYRDMSSKYGEKWIEENVEEGNLVYADWLVTGADQTGRMACRDPNLQNIPVREQPVFRSFFTSINGTMIVTDVKQQEPCITAHLSGDTQLIEDVKSGDVYRPIGQDLGIERSDAKSVFLGATYGLTKYGLSKKQGVSVEKAERFMHRFFLRYKGVHEWMGNKRTEAERFEYVRTTSGRRSWISPYSKRGNNNAVNSPVQGTAADWTKRSLRLAMDFSKAADLPFECRMVIHDERVTDAPTKLMKRYVKIDTDAWTEAGRLSIPSIPTTTEVYYGGSWGCKE